MYGFAPQRGEGKASQKDIYFVGKFRAKNVPRVGIYPVDCRNPKERRVIEFLLPIFYPAKPNKLSITMTNTIFGALSGAWLVN